MRAKRMKFQSMRELDLNRHSSVSDPGPRQALERRHLARHLIEQAFDAHEAVLSRDVKDQLMKKLPFRAAVPFGVDRLHELLQTAFDVGHGPALFRRGAAGQ